VPSLNATLLIIRPLGVPPAGDPNAFPAPMSFTPSASDSTSA
jgi:hypothetical protein